MLYAAFSQCISVEVMCQPGIISAKNNSRRVGGNLRQRTHGFEGKLISLCMTASIFNHLPSHLKLVKHVGIQRLLGVNEHQFLERRLFSQHRKISKIGMEWKYFHYQVFPLVCQIAWLIWWHKRINILCFFLICPKMSVSRNMREFYNQIHTAWVSSFIRSCSA